MPMYQLDFLSKCLTKHSRNMPEWGTIVPNTASTGSVEVVEEAGRGGGISKTDKTYSLCTFFCTTYIVDHSLFSFFHCTMGFQCMCG